MGKKKKNESLPLGMRVNKNGRIVVKDSPLHVRYHSMRMRCENPKDKDYKFYGARGISVCKEWRGLGGEYRFIMWAAKSGYKEGLQLDRIDNNGGYSPENCRWATVEEQQNNRRGNRLCNFKGEKKTIAEIARASKIPYDKALYLINALDVETETVK